MKIKQIILVSFLSILFFSGCSFEKEIDKEMTVIMNTIIETENSQYFYNLIESLLTNKEEDQLLKLVKEEFNQSQNELESLSIKTKEGKEVINHYQDAFESRGKVISILEDNDFTKEVIKDLEKYITQAEDSESKAVEIIIIELNLKDIE